MNNACLVTQFFQWAANNQRIRIARTATTQQITIRLPDYDSPEDPEDDYEVIFPLTECSFDVTPTANHDIVATYLLLTDEIVAQIPLVHLSVEQQRKRTWSAKVLRMSIPRNQITEL